MLRNGVPLYEYTSTKSYVSMSIYVYDVKRNDSFVIVNETVKDPILLPILSNAFQVSGH